MDTVTDTHFKVVKHQLGHKLGEDKAAVLLKYSESYTSQVKSFQRSSKSSSLGSGPTYLDLVVRSRTLYTME